MSLLTESEKNELYNLAFRAVDSMLHSGYTGQYDVWWCESNIPGAYQLAWAPIDRPIKSYKLLQRVRMWEPTIHNAGECFISISKWIIEYRELEEKNKQSKQTPSKNNVDSNKPCYQ